MAYSTVGIVNLGLLRIGAKIISAMDENSPNAIKANAVYPYLLDEVLQVKDWRFAKTRLQLAVIATTPGYAYQYAYALPADFLRLVKPHKPPSRGRNPYASFLFSDPVGYHSGVDWDPPVYPTGFPYVIETMPTDGGKYILTNYNNSAVGLWINYIQQIIDATKFTPAFINCLANRIGAELAIPITEDKQKSTGLLQAYTDSLQSAEAINESLDYLEDETGGTEWVDAGRGFWGPY
jgi:hypothetical protein